MSNETPEEIISCSYENLPIVVKNICNNLLCSYGGYEGSVSVIGKERMDQIVDNHFHPGINTITNEECVRFTESDIINFVEEVGEVSIYCALDNMSKTGVVEPVINDKGEVLYRLTEEGKRLSEMEEKKGH